MCLLHGLLHSTVRLPMTAMKPPQRPRLEKKVKTATPMSFSGTRSVGSSALLGSLVEDHGLVEYHVGLDMLAFAASTWSSKEGLPSSEVSAKVSGSASLRPVGESGRAWSRIAPVSIFGLRCFHLDLQRGLAVFGNQCEGFGLGILDARRRERQHRTQLRPALQPV